MLDIFKAKFGHFDRSVTERRNLNKFKKMIRLLDCARSDHMLLIANQTLSHFDRNAVKRRNLNELKNKKDETSPRWSR